MRIRYVGQEPSVLFRDVLFPRNELVDLENNPHLFNKLSVLEYFEVDPTHETFDQVAAQEPVNPPARKTRAKKSAEAK